VLLLVYADSESASETLRDKTDLNLSQSDNFIAITDVLGALPEMLMERTSLIFYANNIMFRR